MPRNALLGLTFLSGACGLGYEVIYIRLFSNYFGDTFFVASLVFAGIFLGMSLGAWFSNRLVTHLPWIEATIGLFAVGNALLFSTLGFSLTTFGGTSFAWLVPKIAVLLMAPAFLIGTCVPLFHHLLAPRADSGRTFAYVYLLYNLGAVSSVLAFEFVFLRALGLTTTLILLASLNGITALSLLYLRRTLPTPACVPSIVLQVPLCITLTVLSFASGIFQLTALKITGTIFGPLSENTALVIANAILGLSVGSYLVARVGLTPRRIAYALCFIIPLTGIGILGVIQLWSWALSLGKLTAFETTAIKGALITALLLPTFVLFGTLVPLVLKVHGDARAAGRLLAISSFSNGLGALAFGLLLYGILPLWGVLLLVAALCALSVLHLRLRWSVPQYAGAVLVANAAILMVLHWPTFEFAVGYRGIENAERLHEDKTQAIAINQYKDFSMDATIVYYMGNRRDLMVNGYRSLILRTEGQSAFHERLVGSTPVLFAENTDTALVFGLGSGITAGATADLFENTTVVEINRALLSVAEEFAKDNGDIRNNSSVDLQIEDGIVTLLTTEKTYDAIVNTVTSPHYYSSSKLYTKDFFTLVKERLAPGGIYSSWFDVRIGLEGTAILANTLESVFADCRYILLSPGYYNVVCANEELEMLPAPTVGERLRGSRIERDLAFFGIERPVVDWIDDLTIPLSTMRHTSKSNTLDRALLEFTKIPLSQADKKDAYDDFIRIVDVHFNRLQSVDPERYLQICSELAANFYQCRADY